MESTREEFYHHLNKVGVATPNKLKEGELVMILSKFTKGANTTYEKSFNNTVMKVEEIDLDPERKYWEYKVSKFFIHLKSHQGKTFKLEFNKLGFHYENSSNRGQLTSIIIKQNRHGN